MNTNNNTEIQNYTILISFKNDYKSCVIYKGVCSCSSRNIGEIKSNREVRLNNSTKILEISKPI